MSFRSRGGRGGFSGGGDRGRGGSGRGGGRGGFGREPSLPPDTVEAMGVFKHPCEGEMVFQSTHHKIPKFNAPIYFENKQQIGVLDEIFGPLNQVFFTVKPANGIQATSFKEGDKVFIAPDRLLPAQMFIEETKPQSFQRGGRGQRGSGRGQRGDRGGGRGGFRGGRGQRGDRGSGRGFGGGGRGGFNGNRGFGGDRGRGRGFGGGGRGADRGGRSHVKF